MPTLMVVQPILTSYRLPILRYLAEVGRWNISVIADVATQKHGFSQPYTGLGDIATFVRGRLTEHLGGKLLWQIGVLTACISSKAQIHWLCGNPRDMSMWLSLIALRIRGKVAFIHGQGAYSKDKPNALYRFMYRTLIRLSTGYIAYTPLSRNSLVRIGVDDRKVHVAENSLTLSSAVPPGNRQYSGKFGILFVGRLRHGSNIEALISATQLIRNRGLMATLEIIGEGVLGAGLIEKYSQCSWITWHGAIYSDEAIADISKSCVIGCYPGDAGLSVVQYMGLSLVPVVHDTIKDHMGPEPSYIVDGENGRTFSKSNGSAALSLVFMELFAEPWEIERLAKGAWLTFEGLTSPELGARFDRIFTDSLYKRK